MAMVELLSAGQSNIMHSADKGIVCERIFKKNPTPNIGGAGLWMWAVI
jgi:hypothetical protein